MSTSINGTTGIDVSAVSSSAITADRTSTDGTIIDLQKDGTTRGVIGTESTWGSGPQFLGSNSRGFIIANPNTSVNEIIPNVDTVGKLGNSSNRWADLYLSGGVYLGGTGSSNLLQDYEIGSFTPTVSWGTGSASYTSEGSYVKIGDLIYVRATIAVTSTGGTNTVSITNLPFTTFSSAEAGYGAERSNTGKQLVVWTTASSTSCGIKFYDYTDAGNNGNYLVIGLVYRTP